MPDLLFALVWCTVALAAPVPDTAAPEPPDSHVTAHVSPTAPSLASSRTSQHEFTLPNGVHVTLTPFETDNRATLRLVFGFGTADETRAEAGLTRVLAEWITQGDTAPGAVTVSSEVTADALILDVEVAPSAVPDAITALHKRIGDVTFLTRDEAIQPGSTSHARFDASRTAAAHSRTNLAGHADARQALRSVLFQEVTYGRPEATDEQIRAYTPVDLQSFVQRHLTPKQTSLYVVGSFRRSETEVAATKHLGSWTTTSAAPPRQVTPVSEASLRIFGRPTSVEATLAIGTPVPGPGHQDAAALEVATLLVGGGHASRLAQAESVPYASSPYSLVAPHRDASYWVAVASSRATHAQPVLQTMRRILSDLRDSPPDCAEVQHAQTVLIDRFLLQSSTRDGLADQLMFLDRHGLTTDYFMTYQERVRSVTPSDVQRVVETYLTPDRLTIVATGPKRLLQPQLAPVRERIP